MQTVGKLLKTFKTDLQDLYPVSEIQAISALVFEHILGFSKTDLILNSDKILSEKEMDEFKTILDRIKRHEPVQYILGRSHFYNCVFELNPDVLIPRPETEELVDWINKENKEKKAQKILDIGTGSGCIAVALALNLKNAEVWACDISEKALETASKNALLNNARVNFFHMDILAPTNQSQHSGFDLIVSNPPYILNEEKGLMKKNVLDFEPGLALFVADEDPLLFYRAIVKFSHHHLKPGGSLYFEINEAYGKELTELIRNSKFEDVRIKRDINGKNRMVSGKMI